jgi:predicted acetyltransferase
MDEVSEVTIRQVQGDEMLDAMYPAASYAFEASPPLPDLDEWKAMILGYIGQVEGVTCFAAYEDDDPVACAASTAMTQNVRGALLGMGGVWGVATLPAARRKGYCRRLIGRLLDADHRSRRPLSVLYPFRESFYQRMGYVTLPQVPKARFKPSALAPLLKLDLAGEVDLMGIDAGYEVYRDYLRQIQPEIHGLALSDLGNKAGAEKNRSWVALATVDDRPVGLMLYELRGAGDHKVALRVSRFYYSTSQGRYLLLRWIARHIDQAQEVEMWLAPFEVPETWLADMGVTVETEGWAPMGRVADVAQLDDCGVRTGPGRFSARITDSLCPWNEGAWRFETVDGGLHVATVQPDDAGGARRVDCDLTIQALTTLVYGTHDPGDFVYRGWGDPSPRLQATLREMFPRKLPHVHERF